MALASTYLAAPHVVDEEVRGAVRGDLGVQLVAVIGVEQDVELDVGVALLETWKPGAMMSRRCWGKKVW